MRMSYYKHHIFFCTNLRDADKRCCEQGGGTDMCTYAKDKLKKLDLYGAGKVRVSSSGCMGRCKLGPVLVIYPEQIWYSYASTDDIDEIIHSHIIRGLPVKRLILSENHQIKEI